MATDLAALRARLQAAKTGESNGTSVSGNLGSLPGNSQNRNDQSGNLSSPGSSIPNASGNPATVEKKVINPSTPGFEIKMKVAELEQAILARHPSMPTLLQTIWKTLKEYPENVTLLEEEEIHKIVEGLKIQTGVQFAVEAVKSSKGLKAKIDKLGAGAF